MPGGGAPGGDVHGDPRHPHVTVPSPGSAAVAMPQGTLPCPAASLPGFATGTELAWGQPEDIREELLEEVVELLGED